jgi:DNA-binding beta-propeller fold protein YncE
MTTPDIEPETPEVPPAEEGSPTPEPPAGAPTPEDLEAALAAEKADERRRRWLLAILLLLLLLCCCLGYIIFRYLSKPQPLPEMLIPTQVSVCYPPTYKFSITGVDGPVSLALSPDGKRIYAAEGSGQRLVKAFDQDGNKLLEFAPPGTDEANREPKYMAVGPDGRVYLVDRTSDAIDIYDPDGNFIDAIIGQDLTLTEFLTEQIGPIPSGTKITHYEGINHILTYQEPNQEEKSLPVTFPEDAPQWSPLGLRFDSQGNLIYTDTTTDEHSVHIIPADALTGNLADFNPQISAFGKEGPGNAEFEFPQSVSKDAAGNFYVSDGNKSRIDVWTPDMQYKTFFGFGSAANGALNLPRGTWMYRGGCLLVADAVGSLIRVYDISGTDPAFAFEIGGFGIEGGQFNYPVDVIVDPTGRLYVADRGNNRIEVWSY